jgi:DNA-binding transcriptional ArsR family regulator
MDRDPDVDVETFSASQSDVADFYASHTGQQKAACKKRVRRSAELPAHAPGERFIRGPIPMEWMKLAAKCGHRAEAVALLLWYAAGIQRANPIKLSKGLLRELSVNPRTARRALDRFEQAGLVDVEFHRGRAPLVTLKAPQTDPGE